MSQADEWLRPHRRHLSDKGLALLRRARKTLEDNILVASSEQLPWHPLRGICPSPFNYRGLWNWDSAFHAVAVSRWDPELAREQITAFLNLQLPTGALPDVVFEDGNVVRNFGKPPVMPWACAIVDKRSPDDAFLADAYRRFTAYESHWRADRGGNDDGLFHYDSLARDDDIRNREAKYESGWDNSVRWDSGIRDLWPVDLNCYMVMLYQAMAYMAGRLSRPDEKAKWLRSADRLSKLINGRFWDADRGSYLDYNRVKGEFSSVLSPASFVPLYVRIAPKERAKRMAELAADPRKFYPGCPTVAYDDPAYSSGDYWRGPTWLNTAYFALKGLKLCGFDKTADACRRTILDWCAAQRDSIYEYYDSKSGKGLGAKQFGWSAAFIIEFILNWNKQSDF